MGSASTCSMRSVRFSRSPGLNTSTENPTGSMSSSPIPQNRRNTCSRCVSRPANDRLSFAEAARWLVFLQAYGTAGIKTPVVGNTHVNKGKVYAPKDSVGTGWLGAIGGIFLQGDTLFQTLLLNWVFYDKPQDAGHGLLGNESDLPAWEWELPSSPADIVEAYRDPSFGIGPAALMTWQSRRVRLIPDEEGSSVVGVVCCYGDILRPINMQFAETMTRWRESTAQQKKLGTAARALDALPARPRKGALARPGVAALCGRGKARVVARFTSRRHPLDGGDPVPRDRRSSSTRRGVRAGYVVRHPKQRIRRRYQ